MGNINHKNMGPIVYRAYGVSDALALSFSWQDCQEDFVHILASRALQNAFKACSIARNCLRLGPAKFKADRLLTHCSGSRGKPAGSCFGM